MKQQMKVAEKSIRRRIGTSIDTTFENFSKFDTIINERRPKIDTI